MQLYEARSQVDICENQWMPLFEDFRTHMSQSVEKYLDVVGTCIVRNLIAFQVLGIGSKTDAF